jgi:hypothetical protein
VQLVGKSLILVEYTKTNMVTNKDVYLEFKDKNEKLVLAGEYKGIAEGVVAANEAGYTIDGAGLRAIEGKIEFFNVSKLK